MEKHIQLREDLIDDLSNYDKDYLIKSLICFLPQSQLEELKDSLQQCLNLLPDEALVGLVTFGTNVQLHELGYTECPKSFVFRGEKALDASRVSALLGIRPGGMAGQAPSTVTTKR